VFLKKKTKIYTNFVFFFFFFSITYYLLHFILFTFSLSYTNSSTSDISQLKMQYSVIDIVTYSLYDWNIYLILLGDAIVEDHGYRYNFLDQVC